MNKYKFRYVIAVAVLLTIPAFTCGVGPVLLELTERVEALEADTELTRELADILEAGLEALVARVEVIEEVLFSEPVETVLLDDDFEDGIDPGWVQVEGTTQTIAPTSDCESGAYWTEYRDHCGSLGLIFDEAERYEFEVPVWTPGVLTLYFHDDASDRHAVADIQVDGERLGVLTDTCPDYYWVVLTHGFGSHCTSVPRRTGWQRVDFVRTGVGTRGYINHILVFETKRPDRPGFWRIALSQERPSQLLNGFAIDDVRFTATE